MKKIILFRPKSSKNYDYMGVPLGLLAISRLIHKDYDIKIIDAVIERNYVEKILEHVDENVICLGITSMTGYQIHEGLEVTKAVKEKYSNIPIIWGGFHSTLLPEQTILSQYVDIIVRCQGERTFEELVHALDRGLSLKNILGITYKKDGKIFSNPDRQIEDINNFPPLPYHLLDLNKYIFSTEFSSRSINYISSYGCPFRCGFCAENKVNKRKWNSLNAEKVVNELEFLVKKYDLNGIVFSDNNFFVNEERVRKICEQIIKRKMNIKWGFAEGRVEQLSKYDSSTWKLMKESGCFSFLIGSESGSQKVLDYIKKDINVEDILRFTELCKKYGMKIFFSFVFGFPRNDNFKMSLKEEFKSTMDLINKIIKIYDNYSIMWFLYMPYPGTPLYESSIKNGFDEPKSLEEWSKFNLLEETMPWVGKPYLKKLQQLNTFIFPCISNSHSDLCDMLNKRLKIFSPIFILSLKMLRSAALFRLKHNFLFFPIEYKLIKFAKRFQIYQKIAKSVKQL